MRMINEQARWQFRAEFFNAFNHPSWSGMNTSINSTAFGRITSAYEPRIIQFALRLDF